MNRFNDTHPQKATDHTVLMVYNTSIDTKIFTFQLPGWCDRRPPLGPVEQASNHPQKTYFCAKYHPKS